MSRRKWIIAGFFIVALLQWMVAWNMIWKHSELISTGKVFRLKMIPFDREDPFRGDYLQLKFIDNGIRTDTFDTYKIRDRVYVVLGEDAEGNGVPVRIEREVPVDTEDFIRAEIQVVSEKDTMVFLDYSIGRYYIGEKTARRIKDEIRDPFENDSRINYALVRVKSGETMVEDVIVDNQSLKDWK